MTRKAIWLALAAAAVSYAQEQQRMEVNVGGPPPGAVRRREPEPKKMTPEQLKRGRAWLEAAESEAKGLEGGMRAYALLQVAKAYGAGEKKHAVELLEDALAAAKAMDGTGEEAKETRERLQQQIVQAMVPLAPERADEWMMQLDPRGRESVLRALLAYYRKTKQNEHAVEMVYRIAAEKEFPYGAGSEVMRELPQEDAGALQQMFTTALESYRNHTHGGVSFGPGDFPAMILEFYPRLSPDLVKQGIAEVLRQAEESGKREGGAAQIQIASAQGSAALGSMYDYRLFQLMPALRAVDPEEAERLLRKNREVAGMLEKYPGGASDLGSGSGGRSTGAASFMVSGHGPGPRGGPAMPEREEMARAQKIIADAEAHPQDALANVATLRSPEMKADALQGIARATWKKNPGVATSALKQLVETLAQLEEQRQLMPLRAAAGMYLEMGEAAEARKVVEKGLETAAKLYQQDTDADDPNQALEAYWPSANAYSGLLRVAAEIEPNWALERLKELPDDELRALARIAMASALLGQPPGQIMVVSAKKDGTNMMMQSVE